MVYTPTLLYWSEKLLTAVASPMDAASSQSFASRGTWYRGAW
jgi:hypothetical protein